MKRLQYCKIISCPSNRGTTDENIHMFAVPNKLEMRQKWEAVLVNHPHNNGRLICSKHFDGNDIEFKGNKCKLKTDAIPVNFESELDDNCQMNEIVAEDDHGQNCEGCQINRAEIHQLEEELEKSKLAKFALKQHDATVIY